MAVNGVSNDRNYTTMLGTGAAGNTATDKVYNAIIKDGSEDEGVSMDDFFSLMITQLTNQDFMNPADDTQYMSQMAQFYSMQAMKELAGYTQQGTALSLVGKTVTASKNNIGGATDSQTGVVEKLVLVNGDYQFYINGQSYTMNQISQVHASADAGKDSAEKPETEPKQQ